MSSDNRWQGRITASCRPDLAAVLAGVEAAHMGRHVGVLFCGPLLLERELRTLCLQASTRGRAFLHFRHERF